MYNIMIYSIILLFLLMLLMVLLFFISFKCLMDWEKSSLFECGFNPFNSSRIPFSSLFFNCSNFFDVELVIIMPMVVIMPTFNAMDIHIIMLIFLIILTLGLYHEWYNNMLNWV